MTNDIQLISAEQCVDLRHRILRPHMDRSSNEYTLDKHVDSFHLGAHSNDKLIGIASCFQELFSDLPMANCYRLRGMAIDTAFQNQSIGSQLIDYTFNLLNIRQSPILWCNARESAMGYYKKLGFLQSGDTFDIEGIGAHYKMYYRLGKI